MCELRHNSQLPPHIAIVFDLKPYVRGFANGYLFRVKIFTSYPAKRRVLLRDLHFSRHKVWFSYAYATRHEP